MFTNFLWYVWNAILIYFVFDFWIGLGIIIVVAAYKIYRLFIPKPMRITYGSVVRPDQILAKTRRRLMFLAAGLMIYICVDSYLVTNTVTPPPKCGEGIMKLKDSLYDYETDEHCKPVKAYRKWGNFTSVYIFDQPVKKVEQPSLLDANAQLIVHCTPPEEFAIKIKSTFEVAWVHHQTEHAKEENAYKATARYKRRTIVTSVIPELRQLPDKSYAFITNLFTTYEYRATN